LSGVLKQYVYLRKRITRTKKGDFYRGRPNKTN